MWTLGVPYNQTRTHVHWRRWVSTENVQRTIGLQSASTNEPGKRKRQQKRHYEEVLRTGPKNEKTQSEWISSANEEKHRWDREPSLENPTREHKQVSKGKYWN